MKFQCDKCNQFVDEKIIAVRDTGFVCITCISNLTSKRLGYRLKI